MSTPAFWKKWVWRNEKEPFAAVSARFYCESEHLTRFMSRKYLNSCFCVNSDQIPMKPPLNCSPNFTILQIYIHGIYTGWHNLRDFHGDWLRILCTEFKHYIHMSVRVFVTKRDISFPYSDSKLTQPLPKYKVHRTLNRIDISRTFLAQFDLVLLNNFHQQISTSTFPPWSSWSPWFINGSIVFLSYQINLEFAQITLVLFLTKFFSSYKSFAFRDKICHKLRQKPCIYLFWGMILERNQVPKAMVYI